MLNKPSSGINCYTVNDNITRQTAATPSPLENPNTPLLSAPEETRIAYKDKDGKLRK